LEKKLPGIVAKYHDRNSKNRTYLLVPLRAIHFDTRTKWTRSDALDKRNIILLLGIAVLILGVACVNHINLSTARADARRKEIGIRKTVGASRRQLARQFLGESFILALGALLLALAASALLLPAFRTITGNAISLRSLLDGTNAVLLLGLYAAVGLLAGVYPALHLAALKPANVMKTASGSRGTGGTSRVRNALTVFQFGVTVVLIIGALVIQKQLLFMKSRDIGYRRDNVVVLRSWDGESRTTSRAVKSELLKNPLISSVAVANTAPLEMTEANNIKIETESGVMTDVPMVTTYFVDEDYFDLLNIGFAAGRGFSLDRTADIDHQAVINETAARMAGLKDPIGKIIRKWGENLRIIGVVKDFHYTSFRTGIPPLMFTFNPERSNMFLIRLSGLRVREALSGIDSVLRRFNSNFAFDYAFLDDLYNRLYLNDANLGRVIMGFSILAMALAAIGLYGLIAFVVVKKTKEIGIRKILGASTASVTGLILAKFFALIAAAVIAALPAA
jgi:putative ABC transport system permease protein